MMAAAARRMPEDDELLDAYSRAVVGVVERAGPAVVSLEVGTTRGGRGSGAGSGFVVTPDGYVMTNSHVVAGTHKPGPHHVWVRAPSGETVEGQVMGDDPATDLAVVHVDAAALAGSREPTYLPIDGTLAPRVGQLAVAIGNPLGFDSTVSTGVVSALGRSLRGRGGQLPGAPDARRGAGRPAASAVMIDGVIQHTAPLNPGNSGGPLLDTSGRVLGVNTAIIAQSQGIGFAIAVETAAWVLGQLLQHGRVRRAWLGIGAMRRPLDRRLAYHHGLGAAAVEVQSIEPDGPAARAGLRDGDLLVRFGDTPIEGIDDLHRALRTFVAGTPVELRVIRRGAPLTIAITPAWAT